MQEDIYKLIPEEINVANISSLAHTAPLVKLSGKGEKLYRMYLNSLGEIVLLSCEHEGCPLQAGIFYTPTEYGKSFTIVEIIHDNDD